MRPILAARRVRAATLMLALAALACGGDGGKGTGPSSVSGTYVVETIDGKPLPFVQTGTDEDGPFTASFAAGCCSVLLGGDGAYTRSLQTRFAQAGLDQTIRVDDRGQYSVTGTGVRFISATATIIVDGGVLFQAPVVDTTTATLVADRLSMTSDDGAGGTSTFVFRKQ